MYSFAHRGLHRRFRFRFPFAKNRLSDTSGSEMTFRARNEMKSQGLSISSKLPREFMRLNIGVSTVIRRNRGDYRSRGIANQKLDKANSKRARVARVS